MPDKQVNIQGLAQQRRRPRPADHAGHRRRQRRRQDHDHQGPGRRPGRRPDHVDLRGRLPPLRPDRAQEPAVHAPAPRVQLRRDHGAAPPAAGPGQPDPEARLQPQGRHPGPARAGRAPGVRDHRGPAARCTPSWPGPASTPPSTSTRPSPSATSGRSSATPRSGATPRRQVREDLEKREPESAAFIRPQRAHADIVMRFDPIEGRDEPDEPLSATLLLRPTISHPDLANILTDDHREAMHLKLTRDDDGKPVDALHIHSYADREITREVEQEIWKELGIDEAVPESLGDRRRRAQRAAGHRPAHPALPPVPGPAGLARLRRCPRARSPRRGGRRGGRRAGRGAGWSAGRRIGAGRSPAGCRPGPRS